MMAYLISNVIPPTFRRDPSSQSSRGCSRCSSGAIIIASENTPSMMFMPCVVSSWCLIFSAFILFLPEFQSFSTTNALAKRMPMPGTTLPKAPASPSPPRNRHFQKLLQLVARRENTSQIMEQWSSFVKPVPRSQPLNGEEVFQKLKQQLHSFCTQVADIRRRSMNPPSPRPLPTSLEDEKSLFLLRQLAYTLAKPIEAAQQTGGGSVAVKKE
ncbi:unnamed protein product, partial [Amoebophrya sp. A120]|eukprot:GSA120T00014058001.1